MGGPKVAQIRPQRTHRAKETHLTGPYTLQGPGRVPSARPCRSRRLGAERRPRRYQNEPQRTRRAFAGATATRRAPCCDESACRDGAAPASAAAAAATASADMKGANRGCETVRTKKNRPTRPAAPAPAARRTHAAAQPAVHAAALGRTPDGPAAPGLNHQSRWAARRSGAQVSGMARGTARAVAAPAGRGLASRTATRGGGGCAEASELARGLKLASRTAPGGG